MYSPILRPLRIGGAAILLAGGTACGDNGGTSGISSESWPSRLSDGARFAGTNTATLEPGKADGSFEAVTLSRSHFDLTIRPGKVEGVSELGPQGRLFMMRDAAIAGEMLSQEREFAFSDRQGQHYSLRIQRSAGNGPISQIRHYRDGALVARSVRSWRPVRGGWIATGSTLEVIRDGDVVRRVRSSVRVTQLATRGSARSGISRLPDLANAMRPAALHAQNVNGCQSQVSEYAEAYAEFSALLISMVLTPVVGEGFGQIGDAYERYEEAISELQRCLIQPAI